MMVKLTGISHLYSPVSILMISFKFKIIDNKVTIPLLLSSVRKILFLQSSCSSSYGFTDRKANLIAKHIFLN